jgi:hypothetical protein
MEQDSKYDKRIITHKWGNNPTNDEYTSSNGYIISARTYSRSMKFFMGAAAEAAKEDVKESFELAILESINEAVLSGELDFTDILESDGHGGGIPFVSAIAHKMHHIPPFNLLDKVKQGAEKVAAGALNKLSYYATELAGAPGPFKFVALASIIGIIAEVQFKGMAKHAIIHAIPGVGTIAYLISNVAMALAVVGIAEALLAKKDDEGHDKAEH